MKEVSYNPKITPEHLARKAIVYLRQSSEKQVRLNKESQHLQYAVAERVRALGWKQVEIINTDLGLSAGIASAQREGFKRVLSLVALGEVRDAIQLVFTKFRELWSVRQTFQWFRDHDVELPANPIQGTRLVWKIPTQSLVRDILCNPFYAGAYVWGRRPVTTLLVEGRLEKRQTAMRSAEECRVFIREQLAPTMSATQKAYQKPLAGANRRHRFVPVPVHGIAPRHSSVLFVCGPVNITHMMGHRRDHRTRQ
jgi:hypothetical protein